MRWNKFDARSTASLTFAIAASSSAACLLFFQLGFQHPSGMIFAAISSLVAGLCAYLSTHKLLKPARRRPLPFAIARGAWAALVSFLVTAALLAIRVALVDFSQIVSSRPTAQLGPTLMQSLSLGAVLLLAGAAMYAWLAALVGSVISVALEWTILRTTDEQTDADD